MGMEKMCGKCGKALKCMKTGARVRIEGTPKGLLYQADIHACKCGTVMMVMNDGGYFHEESAENPDVIVTSTGAFYSDELFKMWEEYYGEWLGVIYDIFKRKVGDAPCPTQP